MRWRWIFPEVLRRRTDPSAAIETDLDAAAIVRRARRLRFRVRPEAISAFSGAYLAARPGTGLTFAELRAYEPGDDVRHLDWNVTARQGRPYVRRYIEERALTLRLVVDVSASLRFGPEGESKADRAAQAAALLAAAAIQNGDRVGLILVSDRVETDVPPQGGARHLARIVRSLVAAASLSRKTDLTAALTPLVRPATRRALIVLLSDFLDPGPPSPWRSVSRRNDVIALRFVEPREETLPAVGLLDLRDAETGRGRIINAGSRQTRNDYLPRGGKTSRRVPILVRRGGRRRARDPHDLRSHRPPAPPVSRPGPPIGTSKMTADPAPTPVPPPFKLPRPNLGPEPWSDLGWGWTGWWVAGSVCFVVLTLVLVWSRARGRTVAAVTEGDGGGDPSISSGAAILIRRAEAIREALATRGGTTWRAKTTEEVERDLEGLEFLDATNRSEIVRWLRGRRSRQIRRPIALDLGSRR